MSAIRFELEAESRSDLGKGASRRLRHTDRVPAIIYGGGEAAAAITLDHKKIMHALSHEAFYSHILELKNGDTSEKVILKAVQRHPAKPRIQHVDFQRVRADQKLHMHVPLHFTGEEKAPGIAAGGLFSHLMSDVEITCLPANLPEFIEVDVSGLELDHTLHLSDLKLPEGVQITAFAHGEVEENNQPVVTIHIPRIIEEEEPAPVVEATEEGAVAAEGAEGEQAAAAAAAPGAEKDDKAAGKQEGGKDKHKGGKE